MGPDLQGGKSLPPIPLEAPLEPPCPGLCIIFCGIFHKTQRLMPPYLLPTIINTFASPPPPLQVHIPGREVAT